MSITSLFAWRMGLPAELPAYMYGYTELKANRRKYQPGELRRGLLVTAGYYLYVKKVRINKKVVEIVKLLAAEILSLFQGLIELGRITMSSPGQEDSPDSPIQSENDTAGRPP